MKSLKFHSVPAILLGVLAVAASAHAQGSPGQADSFSYRCNILGDAGTCAVLDASQRGLPIPGPYAAALITKGAGRDDAINAAALLGERPVILTRAQVALCNRGPAQSLASCRAGIQSK